MNYCILVTAENSTWNYWYSDIADAQACYLQEVENWGQDKVFLLANLQARLQVSINNENVEAGLRGLAGKEPRIQP